APEGRIDEPAVLLACPDQAEPVRTANLDSAATSRQSGWVATCNRARRPDPARNGSCTGSAIPWASPCRRNARTSPRQVLAVPPWHMPMPRLRSAETADRTRSTGQEQGAWSPCYPESGG